MPPTDILQRPHRHYGSSSEFHDQPTDLHDCREVTTLPVEDLACPGPPLCPPDSSIYPSFGPPCWKRLISTPLTTQERASLITTIFSNRDGVKMVRNLCADDTQAFIDVIYEVRSLLPPTDFAQTSASRRSGFGQPRSCATGEVPALFMQDMWCSSPTSETTGHYSFL